MRRFRTPASTAATASRTRRSSTRARVGSPRRSHEDPDHGRHPAAHGVSASGAQVFEDYEKAYEDPTPEPYAVYGYEAARLVIDAIRRAGDRGNERAAVVEQLFRTKGRESVLGTYDIDQNGDTTLTTYGAYRIRDGQLSFNRTIEAPAN